VSVALGYHRRHSLARARLACLGGPGASRLRLPGDPGGAAFPKSDHLGPGSAGAVLATLLHRAGPRVPRGPPGILLLPRRRTSDVVDVEQPLLDVGVRSGLAADLRLATDCSPAKRERYFSRKLGLQCARSGVPFSADHRRAG